MKIRELATDGGAEGTQPFKLELARPRGAGDNCFSILVGANGTRKSRTLRDMVDMVMLSPFIVSKLIERKAGRIRFWIPAIIPHVIAVSGVATDRFPSRMNSKRMRSSRTRYSYIGPRTANNLVSRAQSIQHVVVAILGAAESLTTRSANLRGAFNILKLEGGVYFELKVDPKLEGDWSTSRLKKLLASSNRSAPDRLWGRDLLERSVLFLREKTRAEIRLDLDDENALDVDLDDSDVLHLLLQAGVMRVANCWAINAKGIIEDLEELSSGQWHLFSSLIFVAVTVQNDTLVLVDEPENSLHPAWQQEYLPLLQKAISSCKGVHVVVSTHSPHVASSLSSDIAEVIALTIGKVGVRAKPLASGPYGWAADDILRVAFGLETTRSRGFTRKVDAALKLFAKGNRKDPVLVKNVEELASTVHNLPADDSVREIIETMSVLIAQQTKD